MSRITRSYRGTPRRHAAHRNATTFEEAVAWPEHAPLLLPFLNDSIHADVDLMVVAMADVEHIDEIWEYVTPGLLRDRDFVLWCMHGRYHDPIGAWVIGGVFTANHDAEVTLLCLRIFVHNGGADENDVNEIVGDGNTDSPLWANAAFIAAAIAILGPEYIVPRVAPGLVAHADVLATIRRGRASSRA
jgi:hypothetical protein